MFNFTDESSMPVDRLLKLELGKSDGEGIKDEDEGVGEVEGVEGGEDGDDNEDCRCEFGCDRGGGRGYLLSSVRVLERKKNQNKTNNSFLVCPFRINCRHCLSFPLF